MLNIQKHDYILKRILLDILKDTQLGTQLGLKGGTCLYIFYGLMRFSVDLDFNLMENKTLAVDKMNTILSKYLEIEKGRFEAGDKGWLWEASYQKGARKMQVDVSKRAYPDKYIVKQFYGFSVYTLAPAYLFAHKLCAITNRKRLANRDLFDSWFMFEKKFDISEKIIQIRTNQSLVEYLQTLEEFVQKNVNKKQILHGLGELLDEKQKNWVKQSLVSELLAHIRLTIDSLQ